jgi:hypothetical protein
MSTMTTNVQKSLTNKEARENLKSQLAQYLALRPESIQSAHKWMKYLEVAGVVIIIVAFSVAMVLSVAWKSINPQVIPIAWFAFAASMGLTMILLGLDAIILQAFPTILWPGKPPTFVSGSGAVWRGWAYILGGLGVAALWGFFAYATWTQNWAMLRPLINVLGVGMTIAILYSIFQKITKAH